MASNRPSSRPLPRIPPKLKFQSPLLDPSQRPCRPRRPFAAVGDPSRASPQSPLLTYPSTGDGGTVAASLPSQTERDPSWPSGTLLAHPPNRPFSRIPQIDPSRASPQSTLQSTLLAHPPNRPFTVSLPSFHSILTVPTIDPSQYPCRPLVAVDPADGSQIGQISSCPLPSFLLPWPSVLGGAGDLPRRSGRRPARDPPGDPPGGALFALATRPTLLDLGRLHPPPPVTACAGNVILAGRVVRDRYSDQMQAIVSAGHRPAFADHENVLFTGAFLQGLGPWFAPPIRHGQRTSENIIACADNVIFAGPWSVVRAAHSPRTKAL